jgi:hypothetical protein
MISNSKRYLNSNIFRVVANNADHCSGVSNTTRIISPHGVNNAEKIIGMLSNNVENTHELKEEHFTALLPTMRKNGWCCRQQGEIFFCAMGNSAEKCSVLWATTEKNCHNAEQYNIFCEPLSAFKGTVYLK